MLNPEQYPWPRRGLLRRILCALGIHKKRWIEDQPDREGVPYSRASYWLVDPSPSCRITKYTQCVNCGITHKWTNFWA